MSRYVMHDATHDPSHDPRRKRLIYRCRYTGTKETDVLLGRFAARHVPSMGEAELKAFERLMENADPDLYLWISGRAPVPAKWDTPLMRRLKKFKAHLTESLAAESPDTEFPDTEPSDTESHDPEH